MQIMQLQEYAQDILTTTAIRLITTGSNTANLDFEYINIAIFR